MSGFLNYLVGGYLNRLDVLSASILFQFFLFCVAHVFLTLQIHPNKKKFLIYLDFHKVSIPVSSQCMKKLNAIIFPIYCLQL